MKRQMGPKVLISSALLLLFPAICLAARDLTAAANAAVSEATGIARAASLLGVLCGAVIYQVPGGANFGQQVMKAGAIGAGLAFGGPSLLGLFHTIFGG